MIDNLLDMFGLESVVLWRAALLEIVIWAVMFVAVMIDMMTGIRKVKALQLPIDSHGLQRTIVKFGDYGKVTALFMCIDVLGLLFSLYTLPYASGVAAVIAVGIEAWSVRENLRAVRSSAARVTDIVAELAKTQDVKEVIGFLQQLDRVRAEAAKKTKEQTP